MSNSFEEITTFLTNFIKNESIYSYINFVDINTIGDDYNDINNRKIEIKHIRNFNSHIDLFCPECGRESVFKRIPKMSQREEFTTQSHDINNSGNKKEASVVSIVFTCSRNRSHVFAVMFLIKSFNNSSGQFSINYEGTLTKIGQYPSIADGENEKIKNYRQISKETYQELSKALGLYSHGIGIGSFVYLRRIFERLIEEAHITAKNSNDFNLTDEEFFKKRMNEKIQCLKNFLPKFIVENFNLYSILSAGLHTWDEESCKKYFDVVFLSICIILDEKLAQQQRDTQAAKMTKELATLASSTKK